MAHLKFDSTVSQVFAQGILCATEEFNLRKFVPCYDSTVAERV
jgi:hypothetical protein